MKAAARRPMTPAERGRAAGIVKAAERGLGRRLHREEMRAELSRRTTWPVARVRIAVASLVLERGQ